MEGKCNLYVSKGKRGGVWELFWGSDLTRGRRLISDLEGDSTDYRDEGKKLKKGVILCGGQDLCKMVFEILKKQNKKTE